MSKEEGPWSPNEGNREERGIERERVMAVAFCPQQPSTIKPLRSINAANAHKHHHNHPHDHRVGQRHGHGHSGNRHHSSDNVGLLEQSDQDTCYCLVAVLHPNLRDLESYAIVSAEQLIVLPQDPCLDGQDASDDDDGEEEGSDVNYDASDDLLSFDSWRPWSEHLCRQLNRILTRDKRRVSHVMLCLDPTGHSPANVRAILCTLSHTLLTTMAGVTHVSFMARAVAAALAHGLTSAIVFERHPEKRGTSVHVVKDGLLQWSSTRPRRLPKSFFLGHPYSQNDIGCQDQYDVKEDNVENADEMDLLRQALAHSHGVPYVMDDHDVSNVPPVVLLQLEGRQDAPLGNSAVSSNSDALASMTVLKVDRGLLGRGAMLYGRALLFLHCQHNQNGDGVSSGDWITWPDLERCGVLLFDDQPSLP